MTVGYSSTIWYIFFYLGYWEAWRGEVEKSLVIVCFHPIAHAVLSRYDRGGVGARVSTPHPQRHLLYLHIHSHLDTLRQTKKHCSKIRTGMSFPVESVYWYKRLLC